MIEKGVIHGRFQVLHNDHLVYLLAGKDRCRHLYIGITNPDPRLTGDDPADPSRSVPSNNPLTYLERHILVRETMVEAGVDPNSFTIVPFPINFPELYAFYVPMDAVFFLTIYDEWGRRKRARFTDLGLSVEILWERPIAQKGLTGAEVRRKMAEGRDWQPLVPKAAASLLKAWQVPQRLSLLV